MPCLALTARVGLAKLRSALLDVSLHFSEQNCFHAKKNVCLLSFWVKSSRIRVLFSCDPRIASDTGGCKPSTLGRAGSVHPPPPGAFAQGEGPRCGPSTASEGCCRCVSCWGGLQNVAVLPERCLGAGPRQSAGAQGWGLPSRTRPCRRAACCSRAQDAARDVGTAGLCC